jgi:glycosyltransferase 2 family protein
MPGAVPDQGRTKRKKWLGIAFFVLGIGVAAYLVVTIARTYSLDEILATAGQMQPRRLALAALFAAASYGCLTLSDALSLRYVQKPLPYPRTALASFVSLSLGHSIGFAGLSSGAIRFRYYTRWGLGAEQVAKLVLFCGVTVSLGLACLGGVALLLRPDMAEAIAHVGNGTARLAGAACLAACLGYVALAGFARGELKLGRWRFRAPSLRLALAQILVGTVNFALVAACLHQVLLSVADASYFQVAAAYVTANVATLVTHVPGGLGVIESVVAYAMPGAHVIGAVLVFRVIYFLVPLATGTLVFLLSELAFRARDRRASETD